MIKILPMFQLPNYQRFESNETAIQYIFSDRDTSIDTFPRFSATALSHLSDILKYKYFNWLWTFWQKKNSYLFFIFDSVQLILYDAWTTNDSYGGVLQAFADDQVDFLYGNTVLQVNRLNYVSPIMQYYAMRYEHYCNYFFRRIFLLMFIFHESVLFSFSEQLLKSIR